MIPNAFVSQSILLDLCVITALSGGSLSVCRQGKPKRKAEGEQTIVAMDTGRCERSQRSTCMLGLCSPRWSHPLIRRERPIVFPALFLTTTHLHKLEKTARKVQHPSKLPVYSNCLKALWKRATDHWTPFRRRQEPTEAPQHLVLWTTWTCWQQAFL